MKILFYKIGNVTSYSCEMVTSSTFRFCDELYYIGFFQPIEEIKEYKIQKEYFVNIKFPSVDYEIYCECKKKWEVDAKLDICTGKRIIGIGELIKYTFSEAI